MKNPVGWNLEILKLPCFAWGPAGWLARLPRKFFQQSLEETEEKEEGDAVSFLEVSRVHHKETWSRLGEGWVVMSWFSSVRDLKGDNLEDSGVLKSMDWAF